MLNKELLERQAAVELPAREMLGGGGYSRKSNRAFIRQTAIAECFNGAVVAGAQVNVCENTAINIATVNQTNN